MLSLESVERCEIPIVGSLDAMCVIVASHDCDIAHNCSDEPNIEVVVGTFIASADGNNLHAKNARCLHLELEDGRFAELKATEKRAIPKSAVNFGEPSTSARLHSASRRTFQRWLSLRYARGAFPDEFNRRLKLTGVGDRLVKILRQHGSSIIAIYVDLDRGESLERKQGDVYELSIYLLYDTGQDAAVASKSAMNARAAITEAFKQKCLSGREWQHIELVECQAISDEAFSVASHRKLAQWSWDYLSLREASETLKA